MQILSALQKNISSVIITIELYKKLKQKLYLQGRKYESI